MEAKLINSFDISAAGGGKGLLGDIDGDGMMEVVFVLSLIHIFSRCREEFSAPYWRNGDFSRY